MVQFYKKAERIKSDSMATPSGYCRELLFR